MNRTLRMLSRTRSKDRFGHAVNDFFIGRTNRREHTAELRAGRIAIAGDEIIWAKSRAAFHGHNFVAREIKPPRFDEFGMVIALQHVWRLREFRNGFVDRGRPIGVG